MLPLSWRFDKFSTIVAGRRCGENTCPPEGFQDKDCNCRCKGSPTRLCNSFANTINAEEEFPNIGEILPPLSILKESLYILYAGSDETESS